jgi:DNA-binding transcriptional LysR family regulator
LQVFCVAARHRSFKLAADELYLTPSAVSHQMKELEKALGVDLFVRRPRALELTAAGAERGVGVALVPSRLCEAWFRTAPRRLGRALAYANRAVLHWLSHDEAGAWKDLANAQELSSQAEFVMRNVAALKVHVTTVALTGVPAPKS